MSSPSGHSSCCENPVVTQVPGTAGQNAYTRTTASFALPAVDAQVVVSVQSNSWMAVGQPIFISDGFSTGTFQVFALPNGSSTSVVLKFLGSDNDSIPGTSILVGAMVVPTGAPNNLATPVSLLNGGTGVSVATYPLFRSAIFEGAFDALIPLTDNTTGTASDTIAAGVGIQTINLTTPLVNISAAAFITFTPGYAFKILAFSAAVQVVDSTGAKLATVTPAIAGVSTTGGALALTSANMTPVGAVVNSTAISGANTGTSAQAITLVGSAVTAFVTGTAVLSLRIQNMDTANAIASIAAKINALQTGVGP